MRNYISVNAKYYKMGEIDRISSHNFRQSKIDYLLPQEQVKFENKNIVFDENFKAINQDLTLENLDFAMRGQFTKLLEMKKNILKKNNAKHRKNENEVIEMVVALSEEQALNYLENGVDLMQGFENFAKNIETKHGLKPLAISLHLDEGVVKNDITKLNIHAHLTFFNYHFIKQKSVLRTLQRKDFQDMQDIAQTSFQEVGFDFKRGESKELSGKEHLERNDFILAKQKEEIIKLDFEYKNIIAIVNSIKKEEQELLKSHEKLSSDYKEIYKSVGELRELEKTLRKVDFKSFSDENKLTLNEIFKSNIQDNKILNIEIFVKQITSFIKDIHKVEFTNIKDQDRKIVKLEEQLKIKEEQNSTLLNKLNEEREKNSNFEKEKIELLKQSDKLIKTMEAQQKSIKRQVQRNTKLRNQRNRLLQKIIKDNNLKSVMQTRNFLRNSKNRVLNKKQVPEEQHDFKSL